jgi:hypothetical protein
MPNFHLVAADGLNATSFLSVRGSVSSYKISNNAGYQVFVKLHDTAAVPTPGAGVVYTIGAQASIQTSDDIAVDFSNGIGLTITKGVADDDVTPVVAGDCVVDITYAVASAGSGGSGGGSSTGALSDRDKVRVLIGDYLQTSPTFSNDEIDVFLDVTGGSLFLAAAVGLDTMAAKQDVTPVEFSIGKYQQSTGRTQIRQLTQQAEAFRQLEYNTPAYAIIETDNSSFAQLEIIRNRILRNFASVGCD